ncbi:MAG: hypothetical protein ACRECD_15045 [Burkholderiaceae bacterium]
MDLRSKIGELLKSCGVFVIAFLATVVLWLLLGAVVLAVLVLGSGLGDVPTSTVIVLLLVAILAALLFR